MVGFQSRRRVRNVPPQDRDIVNRSLRATEAPRLNRRVQVLSLPGSHVRLPLGLDLRRRRPMEASGWLGPSGWVVRKNCLCWGSPVLVPPSGYVRVNVGGRLPTDVERTNRLSNHVGKTLTLFGCRHRIISGTVAGSHGGKQRASIREVVLVCRSSLAGAGTSQWMGGWSAEF